MVVSASSRRLKARLAPKDTFTRDGQRFDSGADVFKLRGSGTLNTFDFLDLQPFLDDDELSAVRTFIVHCLQTRAVGTARHHFTIILRYARQLRDNERLSNVSALARFKIDGEQRNADDQFRYVRIFLIHVSETHPSVCDPEVLLEIKNWQARGRQTHLVVTEGDPDAGPLTPAEEDSLRKALEKSDHDSKRYGSVTGFTARNAIRTVLNLGLRPYQLTLLKEEDVIAIDPEADAYGLYVPRIKNGVPTRKSMRLRPITRLHYLALQRQIESNRESGEERENILFPRIEPGLPQVGTWSVRPGDLGKVFCRWVADAGLRSSEHGGTLHLNPYRLRYTFATNLAAELSPAELADVLDHVTPNCVMIYFQLRDDFSSRLGKALDVTWSKFSRLFLGTIQPETREQDDPTKTIYSSSRQLRIARLGVCGSQTLCHLYPPLSCYVCPKFQVDPDADHQLVLSDLIAVQNDRLEQTERVRDRLKAQLDRVIVAVKQLLEIVKALKWVRTCLDSETPIPRTDDGDVDMFSIAKRSGAEVTIIENDHSLRQLCQLMSDQQLVPRRTRTRRPRE